MPIIVGQVTWGTPLFSDRIRSVILNPYWNVPQSIARKEVLAKVFADRSYLSRESMEIVSGSGASSHVVSPHDIDWASYTPGTFPYRLRQRPGPLNPLGRIKFLFPNRFNVYLHDTPSGRLFALPERALSHGCIRIARPLDLAAWLFRDDPRWSGTRVADAIKAGSQEAILLAHPVPLHIFYFTAVASADGRVEIYKDLYGIDASLSQSLRELSGARGMLLPQ
jgi:murein L,D-transpeptidase YcbB/YkuD